MEILPTFNGLNLLCVDLYLNNIDSVFLLDSIYWKNCIKETIDFSVSFFFNFIFDLFCLLGCVLFNNMSIQQMVFTVYLQSSVRLNNDFDNKVRFLRSVSGQSGEHLTSKIFRIKMHKLTNFNSTFLV